MFTCKLFKSFQIFICETFTYPLLYCQVSVLENWKEREVCKLQSLATQAEAYLKNLKLMSRYRGS